MAINIVSQSVVQRGPCEDVDGQPLTIGCRIAFSQPYSQAEKHALQVGTVIAIEPKQRQSDVYLGYTAGGSQYQHVVTEYWSVTVAPDKGKPVKVRHLQRIAVLASAGK